MSYNYWLRKKKLSPAQEQAAVDQSINALAEYGAQLIEAGPMSVGPRLQSNTGLTATIAPATPKNRFQPLLDEVARLNSIRRNAGLPAGILDDVEGIQIKGGEWPQLPGNVPAAGKLQDARVHMQYEGNKYNPITGKQEVIPVMDPEDPGRMLMTPTGQLNELPGGHEKSSELIAQRALQLMGVDSRINNADYTSSGRRAFWRTDLINPDGTQVDAQVRWTDTNTYGMDGATVLPMQAYTSVAAQRQPNAQREIIIERMQRDKVDPITAVESLIDDGQIYPGSIDYPETRKGKLMKGHPEHKPKERLDQFDEVLMLGLPQRNAQAMGQGDLMRNVYDVQLPDTIDLINVELANRFLTRRGEEMAGNVFVNRNRGNYGDGMERHQIQVAIPREATVGGQPVSIDLVKKYPILQQLLRYQPII